MNQAPTSSEAEVLCIVILITMHKLNLPSDHPAVLAEMQRLAAEYDCANAKQG